MSSASTIASVVVALAAIAVVIRWPRPRADRRVLQRRAHSLEALGLVVTRSATARAEAVARHADRQDPPVNETSAYRPVAITVLGPVDADPSGERSAQVEGQPVRPHGRRASRSPSRRHTRPALHHDPTPSRLVQLGSDDLPPDETLTQTVSSLAAAEPAPGDGASVTTRTRRPVSVTTPRGETPPTPVRRRAVRRWSAAAVAIVVVLGGLATARLRPGGDPMSAVPGETAGATPTEVPPTTDTAPPAPLAPVGTIGDSVTFALPPPFTLELAAGDTTWVRVQATSGEVLFEGTLAPNDTITVPTTIPVQLRVGNPAGLLAVAGGRLIDHPRPPGQPITLALG